jgi:hypothetical protein
MNYNNKMNFVKKGSNQKFINNYDTIIYVFTAKTIDKLTICFNNSFCKKLEPKESMDLDHFFSIAVQKEDDLYFIDSDNKVKDHLKIISKFLYSFPVESKPHEDIIFYGNLDSEVRYKICLKSEFVEKIMKLKNLYDFAYGSSREFFFTR